MYVLIVYLNKPLGMINLIILVYMEKGLFRKLYVIHILECFLIF